MNMLIGVLCEVITAVASAEKEIITIQFVKETLNKLMVLNADENGDGWLQKSEFFAMLQHPSALAALKDVGVDALALIDLVDLIFDDEVMDVDGSFLDDADAEEVEKEEPAITFSEFMDKLLQLRGTNLATVKDVIDLRKYFKTRLQVQENYLRAIMSHVRGRNPIGHMSPCRGLAVEEVDSKVKTISQLKVPDVNDGGTTQSPRGFPKKSRSSPGPLKFPEKAPVSQPPLGPAPEMTAVQYARGMSATSLGDDNTQSQRGDAEGQHSAGVSPMRQVAWGSSSPKNAT
jgi:hypothetical protein